MAPTLQAFGIDRLSLEDRIALATAIWQSIEAEPNASLLTNSQQLELERRLADHDANPNDVVSWPDVKAEAVARFRK